MRALILAFLYRASLVHQVTKLIITPNIKLNSSLKLNPSIRKRDTSAKKSKPDQRVVVNIK